MYIITMTELIRIDPNMNEEKNIHHQDSFFPFLSFTVLAH